MSLRKGLSLSSQSHRSDICPACGEKKLIRSVCTTHIQTLRCEACDHSTAIHNPSLLQNDYHQQHPGDFFLDVLRATRQRQALDILKQIRRCDPNIYRLLDYGCGRGWFLQAARTEGFEVVGVDTSELSVHLLREMGLQSLLLSPAAGLIPNDLPFKPQVVTLLDVAEHFPPYEVVARLRDIRKRLTPGLCLLAMKVPVSNGIMYRTASALTRIGKGDFFDRLYQVGTEPPHLSYFSVRSAKLTVEKAGFDIVGVLKDCDFEPDTLVTRAQTALKLPSFISRLSGQLAATIANSFDIQDSIIIFAKPKLNISEPCD